MSRDTACAAAAEWSALMFSLILSDRKRGEGSRLVFVKFVIILIERWISSSNSSRILGSARMMQYSQK